MKLMERFADVAARVHPASNTIARYRRWILEFHRRGGQWVHPRELGTGEMEAFHGRAELAADHGGGESVGSVCRGGGLGVG
jgi:hypothetical protein